MAPTLALGRCGFQSSESTLEQRRRKLKVETFLWRMEFLPQYCDHSGSESEREVSSPLCSGCHASIVVVSVSL